MTIEEDFGTASIETITKEELYTGFQTAEKDINILDTLDQEIESQKDEI